MRWENLQVIFQLESLQIVFSSKEGKYDLEFDQKEMEKNTDNVKVFYRKKDQYNDFITNAKIDMQMLLQNT